MALRTPLFDWHRAHGGHLVPFGGWDLPVRFRTIVEEHQAVRTAAGLFDVSHMGRLSFAGSQALDLIQKIFTNNAATMKVGQVRYGLICNVQGGVRDDVLVYRWADGWSMVVNASNRDKILAWIDEHRSGLDVTVTDNTLQTAMVAVQGPEAVARCRDMTDADVAALGYYHATQTRYHDRPCLVSRTGYTGEDGLEWAVPAELAVTLCDDLVTRGVQPCGLGTRDTLRLEAAMPLYGHELTEEIDPLQAGLGWAVKLDKGDFLGRAALLERQNDHARPVRVGLEVEGRRAAREGAAVLDAGQPVGKVTSGTITPTLGKAVAMAYVAPDHAIEGATLIVDLGRDQSASARVVRLPFYRRVKH